LWSLAGAHAKVCEQLRAARREVALLERQLLREARARAQLEDRLEALYDYYEPVVKTEDDEHLAGDVEDEGHEPLCHNCGGADGARAKTKHTPNAAQGPPPPPPPRSGGSRPVVIRLVLNLDDDALFGGGGGGGTPGRCVNARASDAAPDVHCWGGPGRVLGDGRPAASGSAADDSGVGGAACSLSSAGVGGSTGSEPNSKDDDDEGLLRSEHQPPADGGGA